MEISPLLIYFWGQADHWQQILSGICIFSFVAAILTVMAALIHGDELEDSTLKMISRIRITALIIGVCSLIFGGLIPSSKTIATMVILPAILKSEPIKRDLPEIYDMAIKSLKDNLGEAMKAEK